MGAGDGVGAARAVLKFSDKQTCVGKEEQEAFCREMDGVFRERCRGYNTVRLSRMLSSGALLRLPVLDSFSDHLYQELLYILQLCNHLAFSEGGEWGYHAMLRVKSTGVIYVSWFMFDHPYHRGEKDPRLDWTFSGCYFIN